VVLLSDEILARYIPEAKFKSNCVVPEKEVLINLIPEREKISKVLSWFKPEMVI
jgi:hypothetical protein